MRGAIGVVGGNGSGLLTESQSGDHLATEGDFWLLRGTNISIRR